MQKSHSVAAGTAMCHLKPDLEARGERELALMEINSLLGRPTFGDQVLEGDFISIGAATPEQVSLLQRRLAFTDYIKVGYEVFSCVQASLERASSDLASLKHQAISTQTRRRNEYLTHGFHKYKAKFFPRMARALINITCGPSGTSVLDPFVGSGTAVIEAYTMGLEGIGVDLDPLSVFIGRQKLSALHQIGSDKSLPDRLEVIANGVPSVSEQGHLFQRVRVCALYELPRYIRCKMPEWQARSIELEIVSLRAHVQGFENDSERELGMLALSHAIATKLNLRWMGTGDNRFSLGIQSASVSTLFVRQLKFMAKSLRCTAPLVHLNGTQTTFVEGSALRLPFGDCSFDGVVTSPPYLPASSGRETYLRSRGPSLIALDLMDEKQLLDREAGMMGSVLNNRDELFSLPQGITELVEWMRPQRARAPKAVATARYFIELRDSLREMARVLKPGGKIALVLASAHVFYDLLTKQTVRTLDMPSTVEALIRDAADIPLTLRASVKMELAKMNYAARPAAKGNYSEAVMIFERL